MRVSVRQRQVVVLEELRCDSAGVEVELVDQQHVRADSLDDLRNRVWLSAARRSQLADKIASVVAVQ